MRKFKRTESGYVSDDGRFVITRTTRGQGINANGGWSPGRTAWRVEDTTGAASFEYGRGMAPKAYRTVDRLSDARDLVASVTAP